MQPYSNKDIDQLASSYGEEAQPDVDAALKMVKGRINAAEQTAAVRPLPNRRRWLGIAAAILLIVSGGYFGLFYHPDIVYANLDEEPLEVQLPDGTNVLVQRGGTLSHAPDFNDVDRRINLTGQAFFEVQKDHSRPFLVANSSTELRVTGTAFNLRVTDDILEVEVSEGAVELRKDQTIVPVRANQCGLSIADQPSKVTSAPYLNRHAWRTGKLYFQKADLKAVLATLRANFGLVVRVEDACSFEVSGTFSVDEPASILENVVKLGGGTVEAIEGKPDHYVVSGTCGK